jgi:hypothetical protein
MSASSSIKIKAARSSETWINILLDYTAGYPVKSVFSNMYHYGSSDNGCHIENFNNKHRLKEDFGTSVNVLHTMESQTSIVCQKTMTSEKTAPGYTKTIN